LDTPELKGLELTDRREYADAVIAYYEHGVDTEE
jgi:hypothetical protein